MCNTTQVQNTQHVRHCASLEELVLYLKSSHQENLPGFLPAKGFQRLLPGQFVDTSYIKVSWFSLREVQPGEDTTEYYKD